MGYIITTLILKFLLLADPRNLQSLHPYICTKNSAPSESVASKNQIFSSGIQSSISILKRPATASCCSRLQTHTQYFTSVDVKALCHSYQELQITAEEDWDFQPTGENPVRAVNSLIRGRLIHRESRMALLGTSLSQVWIWLMPRKLRRYTVSQATCSHQSIVALH